MVLDSSALVAILTRERGHERLLDAIATATTVVIAAPTVLEVAIVLSRRWNQDARPLITRFLNHAEAVVAPFREEHYEAAVAAFLRFGKGRHPADLNFGDCIVYAFAVVSRLPLLYTGRDFAQTDIESAL